MPSQWQAMAQFCALVSGNAAALVLLMMVTGTWINLTPSQSLGLYQQVDEPWAKNDLVLSCIPPAAAALAIERGYLARSSHCQGHTPVIKRVMGIEGDVITLGTGLKINGQAIANTTIRSRDAAGRSLPVADSGRVGKGELWLISNHVSSSFDARHFGPVDQSMVMFKVEPLWTF